MKITQVTYSRLIALPNYENERVEFSAQVEDGECAEEILRNLKGLVLNRTMGIDVEPTPEGYILRTSTGEVGEVFGSADQWLSRLQEVLPHTQNKRAFVNNNSTTFLQVKQEAKDKDSPRAYEHVQKVEMELAEYL